MPHNGNGMSGLNNASTTKNNSTGTSGTNGTTSKVSHLNQSCVSSMDNSACNGIGLPPTLPSESAACTLQTHLGGGGNPFNFNPSVPGLLPLGLELESGIMKHAMQRVSTVLGNNMQFPAAALSANMHAPALGLLNQQLLQAQWAASAHLPVAAQHAAMAPMHPQNPSEFLGSNSAV
jgi:hypothetical protein